MKTYEDLGSLFLWDLNAPICPYCSSIKLRWRGRFLLRHLFCGFLVRWELILSLLTSAGADGPSLQDKAGQHVLFL